jgi:acyl-CoA oxidase
LATLYGLVLAEENLGWHLVNKTLCSGRGKQLQDLSRKRTQEIAPYSLDIIKALGVPEQFMFAPIAADWKKYNEKDWQGQAHLYDSVSSRLLRHAFRGTYRSCQTLSNAMRVNIINCYA